MYIITLEPGKRGLHITVYDILSMLASGMSQQGILDDFPELMPSYIQAVLAMGFHR
jgi:uncharacterized protein (DUF433 family)